MTDQPTVPPAPPVAAPAPGATTTSGLAIVSLVAGLLAWFSVPVIFLVIPTPLCTIAAIVCGHMARSEIRRNPNVQGDGFALGGLVLGWAMAVSVVLAILAAVLFFGGIAAVLAWAGATGHMN